MLGIGPVNPDPRALRSHGEPAIPIDPPGLVGDQAGILPGWTRNDRWQAVLRSPAGFGFRLRRLTGVVGSDQQPGLDGATRLRPGLLCALVPDELP